MNFQRKLHKFRYCQKLVCHRKHYTAQFTAKQMPTKSIWLNHCNLPENQFVFTVLSLLKYKLFLGFSHDKSYSDFIEIESVYSAGHSLYSAEYRFV